MYICAFHRLLCIYFVHGPIPGTVEHCGVVFRLTDDYVEPPSLPLGIL